MPSEIKVTPSPNKPDLSKLCLALKEKIQDFVGSPVNDATMEHIRVTLLDTIAPFMDAFLSRKAKEMGVDFAVVVEVDGVQFVRGFDIHVQGDRVGPSATNIDFVFVDEEPYL